MNIVKRMLLPCLETLFQYHELGLRVQRAALHRRMTAELIWISAVSSEYDSVGKPNDFLLALSAKLIGQCRNEDLQLLRERGAPEWIFCWPGEHYKLLAAIVSLLQPLTIVEIGTNTGLSTLAMYSRMPRNASLWTFDIVPWDQIRECMPGTRQLLQASDFDGRLHQIVGNLGAEETLHENSALLRSADFIFVDGPKDGVFERTLLKSFEGLGLKDHCLLVLDDIRLWNMLDVWRAIERPKLDFTSFGHYAGTGFVFWER